MTDSAFEALIGAVVREMASELTGLVSVDDKVLLAESLKSGDLRPDFVRRAAMLLPRLAKPLLGEMDLSITGESASLDRIRKVIRARLERAAGVFYVLIDDTDQIADPGNPLHLNRIWGLALAARDLAGLSERLRVVVTMREEVWRRLGRVGAGPRDQADHFEKLVVRLTPSDALMAQIVQQRLDAAANYMGMTDFDDAWPFLFEGPAARMPTSKNFSSWRDLVVTRSRNRPRLSGGPMETIMVTECVPGT